MKYLIRPAESKDSEILKELSLELGYPSTYKEIQERLIRILNSAENNIFVSLDDQIITGWIHVFGSLRLESDPFAEIGGLVVSSNYRNKGIGKALLGEAEKWALRNGFKEIRVRSRNTRKDARRFYEREGYSVKKVQNVFTKIL
ncbi:MAG TPA: GNAT family N-acetyltransferase [Ignavibacteriaceae bacterium]|nr:GNAT family N-acetyltransferase [Ignavibacteriaceae bacterium]